jgi:hypothetical protein
MRRTVGRVCGIERSAVVGNDQFARLEIEMLNGFTSILSRTFSISIDDVVSATQPRDF